MRAPARTALERVSESLKMNPISITPRVMVTSTGRTMAASTRAAPRWWPRRASHRLTAFLYLRARTALLLATNAYANLVRVDRPPRTAVEECRREQIRPIGGEQLAAKSGQSACLDHGWCRSDSRSRWGSPSPHFGL